MARSQFDLSIDCILYLVFVSGLKTNKQNKKANPSEPK